MKAHALHEKHSIGNEHNNIHLRYQYLTGIKQWKFIGYRCSACDQSLKFANAAMKHGGNCRELNKEYQRNKPKVTVITTEGNLWQPFNNLVDGPDL